jgi:hypothetical protein
VLVLALLQRLLQLLVLRLQGKQRVLLVLDVQLQIVGDLGLRREGTGQKGKRRRN